MSDPHPGVDHPGEWLEVIQGKQWKRYLKPDDPDDQRLINYLRLITSGY